MRTKQPGIFKYDQSDLGHWFVKLQRDNDRHPFDLGTNDEAKAKDRARTIWLCLRNYGWRQTLMLYGQRGEQRPRCPHCGKYLDSSIRYKER